MTGNRHRRDPSVMTRPHDELGWYVDIEDRPDVDDVIPESVGLQIKPHPNGYQVTLTWMNDEKERKQRDDVVRFEDPRDEVTR